MIRSVTISAVADLHGNLPEIKSASLVFIGGDIFPGELDKNPDVQGAWFRDVFLPWVDKIPCRRVVLVAGNHDHWIEAHNEELLKDFTPSAGKKLVYLCDSGFEFKRLKIYGTPWVPTPFVNKAFSSDDSDFLREKYSRIPQNVDILITHTVPYDCNYIGFSDRDMRDLGSKELREAVASRNVRFLIGGHIHETRERVAHMDFGPRHTEMVNVACCDNQKQLIRLPIRFHISVEYVRNKLDRPFKVACVGDSITYGFGLDDRQNECYPAQLQKLLGSDYEVKGFGRNGACIRKNGGLPYMSTIEFFRAIDWDADAYIICLGTNDLVNKIDDEFLKAFKEDYKELIRAIQEQTGILERAKDYEPIYLAEIPPVPQLFKTWDEEKAIREINNTIKDITNEYHLERVDFNTCFGWSDEVEDLFSDGIHPNASGAKLLAERAYSDLNV